MSRHVAHRRRSFGSRQHAISERRRAAIRRHALEQVIEEVRAERERVVQAVGEAGAAAAYGTALSILEDARDAEGAGA